MSAPVITGAGGAIGSAVVRRLVAQAVPVLAVDRDAETLAALHEDLGQLVVQHIADVTDPAQVEGYAATAREHWARSTGSSTTPG